MKTEGEKAMKGKKETTLGAPRTHDDAKPIRAGDAVCMEPLMLRTMSEWLG